MRHVWLHIISYRLPEFQSFNFFGALYVFMAVCLLHWLLLHSHWRIIIENRKKHQPVQLDHSEKLARTSHILRPSSWILTLQLWRCYTITVTISSLNLLGAPSQFVWKPLVGSKWSLGSTAPLQYRMYRCCGPHYVMVITWVITYDSRVNINQEFLSISMICQCSSVSTVSGSRSTESSLVGGCGKGANESLPGANAHRSERIDGDRHSQVRWRFFLKGPMTNQFSWEWRSPSILSRWYIPYCKFLRWKANKTTPFFSGILRLAASKLRYIIHRYLCSWSSAHSRMDFGEWLWMYMMIHGYRRWYMMIHDGIIPIYLYKKCYKAKRCSMYIDRHMYNVYIALFWCAWSTQKWPLQGPTRCHPVSISIASCTCMTWYNHWHN